MANTATVLRRALLYVPASSPRFLAKTASLQSDNLTFDLEDSVTPSSKSTARSNLVSHLLSTPRPRGIRDLAVRINGVGTPFAEHDLRALVGILQVDTIVVPKVNAPSDLEYVSSVLRAAGPSRYSSSPNDNGKGDRPVRLLALIESARGVMSLPSICAATPDLDGLIFAAEDFALDLSLTRTPDLTEFLYARSAIVTAARAFRLSSVIDLVCTEYRGASGAERLREECASGKGMGFNGKQCIHPTQVDIVQAMFAPSNEEVEWAVRVVIADDKAAAKGRGAWTLDSKMIDAPVAGKARAIVEKAEACGFNISGIREKWQSQEPE